MRIIVIANGTPPSPQDVRRWLRLGEPHHDLLICADGGAKVALQLGLRPHHAVGDFDSLSEDEVHALAQLGTQLHRHPPAKDETDLELSLQLGVDLLKAGETSEAGEIIILGALGGRIDHELANMMLLAMPALSAARPIIARVIIAHDGVQISLIDARRGPGTHTLHGRAGDLVSLVPFGGDAHGIRTDRLEYPLRDESLVVGPARGVSNVMSDATATVSLQQGMLLCIQTSGEALTS